MNDKGRQYSAQQAQTGKSPGMGTSSRRSNYNPGGGLQDSKKPSDSGRRQQEAFLKANPPATLNVLRREGVPNPYEMLKDLTRSNEQITADSIASFIDNLAVSAEIKEELRKISPSNYTGI